MKILHIIATVNPAGGGPMEGIKQIARALTAMGHIVEVATLDGPGDPWLNDVEFTLHALGPGVTRYGYAPRLRPWLQANYEHYDICIINGLWMFHSFAAWSVLRGSSVPYLVFTHGMLDPWFKVKYPLRHIRKSIYWPLGEHRVLTDAEAVCFTCDEERIVSRSSFKPYKVREEVVSYGTSFPIGSPVKQSEAFFALCPQLIGEKFYLFLSRIHEKKGCDILIEAFGNIARKNPSIYLVMAGPDHYTWRPELERIAKRFGVEDRILWPGMISGDVKWGAYRAAEAFVLPSHQENFGIVVAEAMACGCAVLISNKVNIWREIESDGAGLVANDDLSSTIKMLERWAALNDHEKNIIREQAVRTFENRYEIKHVARDLVGLISRIMQRRNRESDRATAVVPRGGK